MDKTIARVRAFNRFYMPSMRLLGERYLGSEYSVTEARIFFEIYEREGCGAAYIARRLNIDKSYLSRVIKRHEQNGYIRRERSREDGRAYHLFLTEAGKARAEELIRKSNEEIGKIIGGLSPEEERRLIEALDAVTNLLSKGNACYESDTI